MSRKRKKIACIYKISAPNGKFYIGSTNDSYQRKANHWSNLKKGSHGNIILLRTAQKYGIENMIYEELFCILPGMDQYEIEQNFLDDYKPELNISKTARSSLGDVEIKRRIKEKKNSQSFLL